MELINHHPVWKLYNFLKCHCHYHSHASEGEGERYWKECYLVLKNGVYIICLWTTLLNSISNLPTYWGFISSSRYYKTLRKKPKLHTNTLNKTNNYIISNRYINAIYKYICVDEWYSTLVSIYPRSIFLMGMTHIPFPKHCYECMKHKKLRGKLYFAFSHFYKFYIATRE